MKDGARRIYVCTTFREFNGDANAAIQDRFLDSLETQTYTNFELVVTTFGEETVTARLAARSFKSRVVECGRAGSYRYSLTDVVTNGIAALAETGGILLWTTADVILSPAFFETVNAHCGFGVAGLSHPHQAFESIDDYNVGNISYPPSLGDGIDLLFFSDDVLTHGGGGEIIERYRFVDWGVFEHFLVGVANACAEKRVNLWPVEQVAKINNDRVAAREDNAFFDESLRRNWAVCEQFIADCSQSVLLKSLRFCSLCFGPIGASRFLQTFAAEIWQFFIGGGTGHRVPAEWPAFVREFIESHDQGTLALRPREPVSLSRITDFHGFGLGWGHPDPAGMWTHDTRATLTLAPKASFGRRRWLVLTIGDACVEPDGVVTVDLSVNGRRVDTRTFAHVDADPLWRVELPRRSRVRVTLTIRDPRSPKLLGWSDDARPLGIRLTTLTLEVAEHSRAYDSLGARLTPWREKLRARSRRWRLGD